MTKLLKFELRKLLAKKSIYICGLLISIIVVVTFLIFATDNSMTPSEVRQYMIISSLPNCAIDTILPILVAILICDDYKSGVAKTIISRGYSRENFYCAKFIVTVLVTIVLSLICWVTTFVLGEVLFAGHIETNIEIYLALFTQFTQMLVIASISFFVAILFKKVSITVIAGILSPTLVSLLLSPIDSLFEKIQFNASEYWVVDLLADISILPVEKDVIIRGLVTGVVYIAFMFFGGILIFKKRDI